MSDDITQECEQCRDTPSGMGAVLIIIKNHILNLLVGKDVLLELHNDKFNIISDNYEL